MLKITFKSGEVAYSNIILSRFGWLLLYDDGEYTDVASIDRIEEV